MTNPNGAPPALKPSSEAAVTKPNGIRTYRDSKLASQIADIHRSLVLNVEIKKIPEGTFVTEILPVLTGDVISADFPLLMAAVAGNPFLEVDVIDSAGNTLFRMPALLERDIVSHKEASKRGSMQSMIITSEMLMHQSPQRAEKYLEHEFNGRGIALNRDAIINKRQERWIAILARYGKTLAFGDTTVTASSTVAAKATTKPQLDYDDGELL